MRRQPRVMTVFGTRPEAIKLAPVIQQLESSDLLGSVTVVTGQHREMLDQVNEVFRIAPDHDLDVMCHGQPLGQIFGRVMDGLDKILEADRPDAVLVQGDTSTATAAAVAAFYRQVPVVHLEAGLRSGDLMSPFPEEAHRKLVSQVADSTNTRSRPSSCSDHEDGASSTCSHSTPNAMREKSSRTTPTRKGRAEGRCGGVHGS